MNAIPFPPAEGVEQPALAPVATPPTTSTAMSGPLGHLKSMMNDKGELDFSNMNYSERIARFQKFEEEANANLVFFADNIFAQIAPGTTYVAIPVLPKAHDVWDDKAAGKIGCAVGETEIKADFVLSVGQRLGVQLKKVFEGTRDIDGKAHYSFRYNAFLTTGDGAVIMVEDVGKDVPLYNSSGLAAHIVESTQKKAQRNAVCALLNIRKIGKKEDFLKPWILLRPIFRDEQILAEQARISNNAKALLFDNTPQVVDVERESDFESIQEAIGEASSDDDFEAIRKRMNAARLTGDERAQLSAMGKQKKESVAQLAPAT